MTDLFEPGKQFPVTEDKPREREGPRVASVTVSAADIELPGCVDPTLYQMLAEPTWFQRGEECTGFALAAAVNFLARRRRLAELERLERENGPRHLPPDAPVEWTPPSDETLQKVMADCPSVSPRMMYEMAQVYDREDDSIEGSTLLGALSAWWRCGVTTEELWPYVEHDDHGERHGTWTVGRISDARTRQLEWSDEQRKISPKDLSAMKAALADNDVLYVDAEVHDGWFRPFLPDVDTIQPKDGNMGFHAFLIVGYNEVGFWVHNSWGRFWGLDGYALLPFGDWMDNGRGVWVPQFAGGKTSRQNAAVTLDRSEADVAREMWGHVVALDDEGRLSTTAPYDATSDTVRSLFYMFEQQAKDRKWRRPRLLVYADDGSRPRAEAVEQLAQLKNQLMEQEIFPIFLVWDVAWRADLDHELQFRDRHGEEDFLLGDGAFDTDNPFPHWLNEYRTARSLAVPMWRALQERAEKAATLDGGGARILAQHISAKAKRMEFDLHVAAHGAGDFLLSELVWRLPPISSVELLAPATTTAQYESSYGQLLRRNRLDRVTITVSDDATSSSAGQRDDQVGLCHLSILHLASRVLAVEGIDEAGRFPDAPSSEIGEDAEEGLGHDFDRWDTHVRFVDGRVELLPVQPILGLQVCLAAATDLTGRPDRVAVETVGVPHFGLPSDDGVWTAVIERIRKPPEVVSAGLPAPSTAEIPVAVASPPVQTDVVEFSPFEQAIRRRDPLRVVLDLLKPPPEKSTPQPVNRFGLCEGLAPVVSDPLERERVRLAPPSPNHPQGSDPALAPD